MRLIYISAFGMLGVLSRYTTSITAAKSLNPQFPYGTLLINLLGSFFAGVIYVLGVERALISQDLRTGILVGFLGGFTTFSAYSLETARLLENSETVKALTYVILSSGLGIAATMVGFIITRRFFTAS